MYSWCNLNWLYSRFSLLEWRFIMLESRLIEGSMLLIASLWRPRCRSGRSEWFRSLISGPCRELFVTALRSSISRSAWPTDKRIISSSDYMRCCTFNFIKRECRTSRFFKDNTFLLFFFHTFFFLFLLSCLIFFFESQS